MDDRKLMQQALEALRQCEFTTPPAQRQIVKNALAALNERLAQPEQKPVAWADEIIDDLHAQYNTDGIKEIDSGDALIRLDEAIAAVEEAEKRHTAPPQRKPLTDEEIMDNWLKVMWAVGDRNKLPIPEFARAIEAAHGIKEQQQ